MLKIWSSVVCACLVLPSTLASAGPAPSPPEANASPARAPLSQQERQRARQRFDRGLELYDARDFEGALREFRSALDVVRHPVVLYNVALVQAKLDTPVECVKTVEELRRDGLAELDAESRARLVQVHDEQLSRIGKVQIKSNVDGAIVQVDGVDIGQSGGVDSLQLAAGEHIISTVASGYIPRRMRVVVPPRGEQEVVFTLQPLENTLAHLSVATDVPDVEVYVDGELVGRTPFPASLAFSPGVHEVALRRAGYLEQKQTIGLDPGGEGHLRFVIQADSAAPERESGTLALTISEPNSLVSINGVPQGMSPASLRLPLGRHRLSVKSAGFLDYERDVVVAPAGTSTHIDLMPTSEFLKDYERGARTTRTWGWVSVGSGAVLIGGSVGFLVWNQAEKDTARDNFDEFSSEVRAGPSGMCDDASCEDRLRLLSDRLSEAENRDVFGWVGVSAGAAVAALGAGLLMWGDHPGRYAPSETSDVFQSARIELGPGQARVSGRF